jgi:hypothetical protein
MNNAKSRVSSRRRIGFPSKPNRVTEYGRGHE